MNMNLICLKPVLVYILRHKALYTAKTILILFQHLTGHSARPLRKGSATRSMTQSTNKRSSNRHNYYYNQQISAKKTLSLIAVRDKRSQSTINNYHHLIQHSLWHNQRAEDVSLLFSVRDSKRAEVHYSGRGGDISESSLGWVSRLLILTCTTENKNKCKKNTKTQIWIQKYKSFLLRCATLSTSLSATRSTSRSVVDHPSQPMWL